MTTLEDTLVAVDAGADAVGFVFYEQSPRCVTVETAREIVAKLPESVEKVGVFVGENVAWADQTLQTAGLTTAQVYTKAVGDWLAWYLRSERKLMMALPGEAVSGEFLIAYGSLKKRFSAIVVDSGSGAYPGGTGERFDWDGAKIGIWSLSMEVPVVVAGGLTPQNVSQAIQTLRPWGVDVASGVEARPGKKDPNKVRAFVQAVRELDKKAV